MTTRQTRTSIPPVIYAVSVLGGIGTIPTLLLWTTELAYMVGQWYLNFLLIITLLTWVSLIGILKLKRWGVIAYTVITILTQFVLVKYNVMWSYTSLIIPLSVILSGLIYFRRMS